MKSWMKLTAVLACGFTAVSAMAGFWDWTRPFQGPERRVSTLVITANYKRPLALAQLIRAENRQPYLLVPAQQDEPKNFFFCPVSENVPAMKLQEADITRFVRLLNPEKIIVLGDERYVPARYLPALEGRIPIVRIDCDDWNKNAATLGNMLNLTHLEGDFGSISKELDHLYKPLPAPAKTAAAEKPAPAPAAEPAPTPEPAPAVEPAPVKEVTPAAPAVPDAGVTGEVTPVAEVK